MMMIENTRKVSSVLCRGILAIAFCILPLGSVDAQDFNAIERKLEEAIDAGDLSRKDAAIMLNALKRSRRTAGGDKETARGDKGSDRDLEAKKRRYDSYAKEIEAAVKAGKLSKEDADKKLIAVRTEMFRNGGKKPIAKKKESGGDKGQGLEAKKRRYESYARGIEAAIKSGKLSEEAAEKKLVAMRKEMFRDTDEKKTAGDKKKEAAGDKRQDRDLEAKKRRYLAFAREIEAAVKSGDLSKEEAEKKLISVRTDIFNSKAREQIAKGGRRGISVDDYRRGEAEIQELVKTGVISREDAVKRLTEMRKLVVRDPGKQKESAEDKGSDRDLDAKKRRYESFARKIETAVKSGDLSKEEAEKKLIEMRKQLFRKGD